MRRWCGVDPFGHCALIPSNHMAENGIFSLTGQVAVVIGGGGVLAGAMATGLAQAGAGVAILDVSKDGADARARSIEALGCAAIGVCCDATSKTSLEQALAAVLARFGHVDILVNAAGVNSGTPFFEITEAEWQRILNIDLTSVFLACQVFGKAMVDAARGGSIINISSASSGPPLSKVFTYAVAKAGVNQITQFLARDLAPHNIRVNAILPGFFPAEQNRKLLTEERVASIMRHTPMNRFGESSELVGAVVYLASQQASSFVTGSILRVDGGFTAMTI
jgi:NAD(P)-dependent dehydrogenase (short-subunit alcohol dehydrogenase family)